MVLNKKNINDLNSLVEVYIEWFLKNKFNVEKVGHIFESPDVGIYYIHNPKTDMYCIITTNYSKYNDKELKNNLHDIENQQHSFFQQLNQCLKEQMKAMKKL
jgi:hypothetical protein